MAPATQLCRKRRCWSEWCGQRIGAAAHIPSAGQSVRAIPSSGAARRVMTSGKGSIDLLQGVDLWIRKNSIHLKRP
ncbi:MAG: hypothetical protein ACRD5K_19430 [Candidatus Acidiferrales bacterium]